MALQMDAEHRVPLRLRHVGQGPVPKDAGVVHQHVELAEGVDCLRDHLARLLPVRDVVTAHRGAPAAAFDVDSNALGRGGIGAFPMDVTAQVVDQDRRPLGGKVQRMGPAEAASRARHYDDPSFECSAHGYLSWTSGPIRGPANGIRF